MKRFWDDLWGREDEFLSSGKQDLRFGYSSVGVSTIAGQFYCEVKVENEVALGEISTESKEDGSALHDELLPLEPIDRQDFVKLVSRRKSTYAVLRVWGVLGGLRIVGEPDHIIWSLGKPRWLVELKTTARGDPSVLWPDQESQTRIYGALLEKMGFDCSGLHLALVRLKAGEISDEERRRWIIEISGALEGDRIAETEAKYRGRMSIHLLNHDVSIADGIVERMSDYWLGRREATSSSSVGKCRACEYHSVCAKSLFPKN